MARRPPPSGWLLALGLAVAVAAGAGVSLRSSDGAAVSQDVSSVSSPTPATPLEPPQTCAINVACANAVVDAIERAQRPKDPVLAPPLVQLIDAEREARQRGRAISLATESTLPPALRGFLSAKQMRLDDAGRVQVFLETQDTPGSTTGLLRRAGARVERVENAYNTVQAWVPVARLEGLARSGRFTTIRLPDYAFHATGSVTSEADALLGVANARSMFGVDGTGVRVGVISDGMQGMIASQNSGDLPAVNTATCDVGPGTPNQFGAGSEGTAMLEIIHDLAPGAELWYGFDGANFGGTLFDFLGAVNCLAQNVDIVVDDIGFFNVGAYDGSGPISVNAAYALTNPANRIKSYYTAVGNAALSHYQDLYRDYTVYVPSFPPGFHTFRPTTGTSDQYGLGPNVGDPFYLLSGGEACVFLQWDDTWGQSVNDFDLHLFDEDLLVNGSSFALVAQSTGQQNGNDNPAEGLCYQNTGLDGYFDIIITRFGAPQLDTLEVFIACDLCVPLPTGGFGEPIHNYNTACNSVPNNADAWGVIAVGAIDAADAGLEDREPYSGCGPTNDGRLKPEIIALDGVVVTGHGGFFTPFFGTSAASPHLGAIAALLLDCDPSFSGSQLRALLVNSADDLGWPGIDNQYGNGRIDPAASLTAGGCAPSPTPTFTPSPTVTPTPTITPTSTPKDLNTDTDGDTVLSDVDLDDDNDGCTDVQETGLVVALGGLRDPHNFWDFFDVPTGAGLTRDRAVAGPDIFAVIGRFNTSGDAGIDPLSPPPASGYHTAYDRGPVVGANAWNLGAANGSVAGTDIFAVLGQFNHTCA